MINIFIANLDFDITSDDLKATFEQFGEVSYAHVVYDNKTKKSKGYGYIEMENEAEAEAAIKSLNGMEVNERAIDVKMATPKKERPKTSNTEEKRPPIDRKKAPHKRENNVKTVKTAKPKRVLRPRRKKKD